MPSWISYPYVQFMDILGPVMNPMEGKKGRHGINCSTVGRRGSRRHVTTSDPSNLMSSLCVCYTSYPCLNNMRPKIRQDLRMSGR